MNIERFKVVFWTVVSIGIAWNIFGVVQFLGSLSATSESLIASGLTPDQAAVMLGYPTWMTISFAIGVFSGLIGSLALLFKSSYSVYILAISLVAYIILYIGDITEGVFKALGMPQIVVLTLVVTIALLLWYFARYCQKTGRLA